ncbi:hypothetical protein MMC11_004159 [Xylographa trunciseda]|nr:hypothetical protein [Xylographa trunciseda]
MAEGQIMVASAVIVPDPVDGLVSPPLTTKRRQSSASDSGSKRQRLLHGESPREDDGQTSSITASKQPPAREANVQVEERKRGKRLFGALLGTLAQSSSSTAQRRRVDIEKKQQAKLKLQDEEYDEKKKLRLDALMEVRRREQVKYNKQSMQIRHSNLLATANFLQTKAEPKLYYKPWDLLQEDEARIKVQIEEAESTIERENREDGVQSPKLDEDSHQIMDTTMADVETDEPETVGQLTNHEEPIESSSISITNVQPLNAIEKTVDTSTASEVPKDHGDDGGDIVVEGEEDTVIY